jgi:hypothetical protein
VDWDNLVIGPVAQVFGTTTPAGAPGVVYRPQNGTAFPLASAIFEEGFAVVQGPGYQPVSTQQPTLGVRLSLFAALPAQGDTFTVLASGQTYIVNDVQPDGLGWAKLLANLAQDPPPPLVID